jgi:hypothetical protein
MSSGTSDPVRYFGRQVRKARLAAEVDAGRVRAADRLRSQCGSDIPHRERQAPGDGTVRADVRPGFPSPDGWFSEFYAESRTWIATPPWFRNWVEHEQRAATLRIWFLGVLTGLLQTEDYARAILAVNPGVTDDEVSARLAAR